MPNPNPSVDATISLSRVEHQHIRQYLTARRRGEAYDADLDETAMAILRRVGFASADTLFPDHQRTAGICVVCGCTERDACRPDGMDTACAWADGEGETICDRCADA